MNIYLDNAATTPLDPQVLEAMLPYLTNHFGNPSSIHATGRKVRTAIEASRKIIAAILSVSPSEIIFTSGGTEADNTFITGAVEANDVTCIITSKIEHPAVLQTVSALEKSNKVSVKYVDTTSAGDVNLAHLEELLTENPKALVSLMHANNEIGNLIDLAEVANLTNKFGAILHSDMVQSMGHLEINPIKLGLDGLSASAHKFHGPKGVGFMYVRKGITVPQFITGGGQERGHRGGTENVYGIVGMAKALELATDNLDYDIDYISGLKLQVIEELNKSIPEITYNGNSANLEKSLYTILNVSLPPSTNNEMLLFNLDLNGISASGGSACASGASVSSHVLNELAVDADRQAVRFSFSRFNTETEVDTAVKKFIEIYNAN